MNRTIRNRAALASLGLSLAVVPFADSASAQATGDRPGTTTDTGTASTRNYRDEGGFNPGWLGLIGLAGLAGLLPRKAHPVAVHRTGETTSR